MPRNLPIFIIVLLVLLLLLYSQQPVITNKFLGIMIAGFLSDIVIFVIQYYQGWKSKKDTKEVLIEELEENLKRINENFYWLIEKEKVFHESKLYPLFDRCFNSFLMLNELTLLSKKTRRHLLYAQNGIASSNSHIWSNREYQSEIKKKTFIISLAQTRKEIRYTLKEMGEERRWEIVQYQRINDGQKIGEETIKKI